MKYNNINKRLVAGMLGGIMLATPLTLTACGPYEYVTDTDDSVKLNSDITYSYNVVRELQVVNIKTKINEDVYFVYNKSVFKDFDEYCDVFTGKIIFQYEKDCIKTEGVDVLSCEGIDQYLISYNMLKESYSVEDLEYLLEKIKQDIYNDNNKELVKNK